MNHFNYDAGVVSILRKYPERIIWDLLSFNPAAIAILEENIDKVNWSNMSKNPSAIHLLEANQNLIDWEYLSANPAAINLLITNFNKINWVMLSSNPEAIEILTNNKKHIHWGNLSANPNAKLLIRSNLHKVVASSLLKNPNILDIVGDLIDSNGDLRLRESNSIDAVIKNIYSKIEIKCTKETWISHRMTETKSRSVSIMYDASGDPFACEYLQNLPPTAINWIALCWFNYWDPYRHAHLFHADTIDRRLDLVMNGQIDIIDWVESKIKNITAENMQLKMRIKNLEKIKDK